MKVLNIIGSPRKNGTSARIAKAFTDEAENLGAKVTHFYLNGMTYKGCQGCEACHTKRDSCILQDDVTAVLNALKEADITIFSSPVYYGDTTGQFKSFFDRLWSLIHVDYTQENPYTSRLEKGKTALFVSTQGNIESEHTDVIERYSTFLSLYGFAVNVVRKTELTEQSPAQDVTTKQAEMKQLAQKLIAIH